MIAASCHFEPGVKREICLRNLVSCSVECSQGSARDLQGTAASCAGSSFVASTVHTRTTQAEMQASQLLVMLSVKWSLRGRQAPEEHGPTTQPCAAARWRLCDTRYQMASAKWPVGTKWLVGQLDSWLLVTKWLVGICRAVQLWCAPPMRTFTGVSFIAAT